MHFFTANDNLSNNKELIRRLQSGELPLLGYNVIAGAYFYTTNPNEVSGVAGFDFEGTRGKLFSSKDNPYDNNIIAFCRYYNDKPGRNVHMYVNSHSIGSVPQPNKFRYMHIHVMYIQLELMLMI